MVFLKDGHLITGLTKAWIGRFGEIGHPYTHPSSKQCSYSYTHPSTKQCDAAAGNHTHDNRYYTESEVNTLLNGKAASSHNHSASNITSGTLSVARGGTGYSNLNDLKIALGITSGGAKITHGIFGTTYGTINCGYVPYALFLIIINGGGNAYIYNNSISLCVRGCSTTCMYCASSSNNLIEVAVTWNDSSVYFNYKGPSGRSFSMAALALGV